MGKIINLRLLTLLLILSICQIECEKPTKNENKFPTTSEEIEKSVNTTLRITKESAVLVENAISEAYSQNELVDPNDIAKNIKQIESVVSSKVSLDGTVIEIEQIDGTHHNVAVVTADDKRMFKERRYIEFFCSYLKKSW